MPLRTLALDVQPRFWAKVDKTGDCWLWMGFLNPDGYGMFTVNERSGRVHRIVYETLVGPIPEGLTIDHLCRVRHCVNPDHLEPVTVRTNTLRGEGISAERARQTHCIYGHPLSGENLYLKPLRNGQTGRICRTCQRREEKKYKDKRVSPEQRRAIAWLREFGTATHEEVSRAGWFLKTFVALERHGYATVTDTEVAFLASGDADG